MNQQIFAEQLLEQQNNLTGLAIKFTKNKEAAKDLVQETFLRALKHSQSFTDGTNLRAWLMTIMRNLFINSHRNRKRRKTESVDLKTIEFLDSSSVDNNGPIMLEFEEWEQQIDQMEESCATAFKMISHGYTYKEIADHLDEPIGTVKSRVFYGRKTLKKIREKR